MINIKYWKDVEPKSFETFIYNLIVDEASDIKLEHTEFIKDGGVDYVYYNDQDEASVLGRKVPSGSLIYIEAKRRERNSIDTFASSIVNALDDANIKCFVLISVSGFNINAFFKAKAIFNEHQIDFIYIHGEAITRYLLKHIDNAKAFLDHIPLGEWETNQKSLVKPIDYYFNYIKKTTPLNSSSREVILNQCKNSSRVEFSDDDSLHILLYLENYSENDINVEYEISAANWLKYNFDLRQPSISLKRNDSFSHKLEFVLESYRFTELPKIYLKSFKLEKHNQTAWKIVIDAGEWVAKRFKELEFIGLEPNRNKGTIVRFIDKLILDSQKQESPFLIIEGESGVGKTRILDEALKARNIKYIKTYVNKNSYFESIIRVLSEIQDMAIASILCQTNINCLINSIKNSTLSADDVFKSLLVILTNVGDRYPRKLLIIFEDIHHSDEELIKIFQKIIESSFNHELPNNLRFCLTGRNDETFPNPYQIRLVNQAKKIMTEKNVLSLCYINVLPLSDEDASLLVNSIFNSDITALAKEWIINVALRNPFNITQVIEYLTEESVIQIQTSGLYSISNPYLFYNKKLLPDSMEEILKLRLSNLQKTNIGKHAFCFILKLSILGYSLSEDHFYTFSKEEIKTVEMLCTSRLLFHDHKTRQIRFYHENILHFINNVAKWNNERRIISKQLIKNKTIIDSLEQWRACSIYHMAEKYEECLLIVKSTIDDGTYSTLFKKGHLRQSYFILSIGVEICFKTIQKYKHEDLLYDALKLKYHASKYVNGYYETINNGQEDIKRLEELDTSKFDNKNYLICLATISQIIGHAYQNMGFIDKSMEYCSKSYQLLSNFCKNTNELKELWFDIVDRLRKNYIYKNDFGIAQHNYGQAKQAIIETGNETLKGSALFGEAELYFMQSPDKSYEIWQGLTEQIENHSDERTKIQHELALVQMEIFYSNNSGYDVLKKRLRDINDRIVQQELVGPVPKVYLLNGLLAYKQNEFETCIQENEKAYAKAEKSNYGIYLWMTMNNIALCHIAMNSDTDIVWKYYKTTLHHMQKQGFLNLLSQEPMFWQTPVVQNIIFFALHNKNCVYSEKIKQLLTPYLPIGGLNEARVITSEIFLTKFGYYASYI